MPFNYFSRISNLESKSPALISIRLTCEVAQKAKDHGSKSIGPKFKSLLPHYQMHGHSDGLCITRGLV